MIWGLLVVIDALFKNTEGVQGTLLLGELTEWASLTSSVMCLCSLNGDV